MSDFTAFGFGTPQTTVVEFQSARLVVIPGASTDDTYVAVKPICEALDIAENGQIERIQSDPVYAGRYELKLVPSSGGGGHQRTFCLSLSRLAGWLFSIHSTRVRAERRDALVSFQLHCHDALTERFFGPAASKAAQLTVHDLLRDDALFEELRRQHEAAFADRHLDAVVAWIHEHVEGFRGATLVRSEPWTDVEGADLVVLEPRGGCGPATRIAARCRRRRFAKYAERGDFTIRPSERPKILEGNARFYFYGIVDQDDEPGRFAHAAFLDLNAFRFLTAQPQDGMLVYNTREKYLPDLVVAAEHWPPGPPRPRLFGYDS